LHAPLLRTNIVVIRHRDVTVVLYVSANTARQEIT